MRAFIIWILLIAGSVIVRTQDSAPAESVPKLDPKTMHAPVPLNAPPVEVPGEARDRRESGNCVVQVTVDATGWPQNPTIVSCTDAIFAPNSLDAVKQYRFKPARDLNNNPIAVVMPIKVNFRIGVDMDFQPDIPVQIQLRFFSPPGMSSTAPDERGIYPLSKFMESPRVMKFGNKGFGDAAAGLKEGSGCHAVVTIDAKGRITDATVSDCDVPILKEPALRSLLASKCNPAKLNGKAVPVRASVHLIYEGGGSGKAGN